MSPPPAMAAATAPAVRPRRGPGRAAPVRPARPARPARPTRPTARPRRISGPAKAGAAAHRLPDRRTGRLLERLFWNPPARAWIAVVATALIGIVAMQVWVVKLGAGIGRAVEHAATLQREDTELAAENSELASGERIEGLAAARGMVPAPPGALHFVRVRGQSPRDVRAAVAALARPVQPATAGAAAGTSATNVVGEPGASGTATASAGTEAGTGGTNGTEPSAEGTPTTSAASSTTSTSTAPTASTTSTAPPAAAATAPEPATAGGTSEEATGAATGAGGGTQAPPGG
jgi:hypothetical protein